MEPTVQQYVHFNSKARFLRSGLSLDEAEQVWICLHGYGQLAPYFVRKFNSISDRASIIVPEGLHRFYLNGNEGRVGASWMTKEDREADISNNMNYLEAVMASLDLRPEAQIVVLGFSQGAATAGRWVTRSQHRVSHLILWSGMFPHDVPIVPSQFKENALEIHVVLGREDPYIGDVRLDRELIRMRDEGLLYSTTTFSGGHEIPATVLSDFCDKITR